MHEQGDADGAKVEEGVENEGPEGGEAPRVRERVEGELALLGGPVQAWEAGRIVARGRPLAAQVCGVSASNVVWSARWNGT